MLSNRDSKELYSLEKKNTHLMVMCMHIAFVVYEIMTSELPFKGFNRFQLLHKIMNGYRPEFKYPIPYEMFV